MGIFVHFFNWEILLWVYTRSRPSLHAQAVPSLHLNRHPHWAGGSKECRRILRTFHLFGCYTKIGIYNPVHKRFVYFNSLWVRNKNALSFIESKRFLSSRYCSKVIKMEGSNGMIRSLFLFPNTLIFFVIAKYPLFLGSPVRPFAFLWHKRVRRWVCCGRLQNPLPVPEYR